MRPHGHLVALAKWCEVREYGGLVSDRTLLTCTYAPDSTVPAPSAAHNTPCGRMRPHRLSAHLTSGVLAGSTGYDHDPHQP